METKAEKQLQH